MLIIWPRAAVPEQIADAKRHGLHVRCGLSDDLGYEETHAVFRQMAEMGVDEIASGRPDWLVRMAEAYGG